MFIENTYDITSYMDGISIFSEVKIHRFNLPPMVTDELNNSYDIIILMCQV